jgi:hypothetical protein
MGLPDVGDGGRGMDQLFMQLAGTPVQPDHEASSTTTKMMVWRSLHEFSCAEVWGEIAEILHLGTVEWTARGS